MENGKRKARKGLSKAFSLRYGPLPIPALLLVPLLRRRRRRRCRSSIDPSDLARLPEGREGRRALLRELAFFRRDQRRRRLDAGSGEMRRIRPGLHDRREVRLRRRDGLQQLCHVRRRRRDRRRREGRVDLRHRRDAAV